MTKEGTNDQPALPPSVIRHSEIRHSSFSSPIAWLSSLDEAYALARETGRPVLVHWTGDGCASCATMDREVFGDARVRGLVDGEFVPVRVNVTQRPDLAAEYGVTRIPADHLLASDWSRRRVLRRIAGPREYEDALRDAVRWAEREQ